MVLARRTLYYVHLGIAAFVPLPLVVSIVVSYIWRGPCSSIAEMTPQVWILTTTMAQLSCSPSRPTFAATFPKFVKVAIQWEAHLLQSFCLRLNLS